MTNLKKLHLGNNNQLFNLSGLINLRELYLERNNQLLDLNSLINLKVFKYYIK